MSQISETRRENDAATAGVGRKRHRKGAHRILARISAAIAVTFMVLAGTGVATSGVASAADATAFATYPNPVDLNQFGISGTWYDAAQSGQGFVISVMPNVDGKGHAGYFGGWFTFADHWSGEWYQQALGTPMWLTLQGDTAHIDPNVGMQTLIFDNDGRNGNFAAPPTVGTSQLGFAYLSMADCNHMHLHYTVEWRANFVDPQYFEMDLTRLMPNVSCVDAQTPQAAPIAASGAKFSGAWYDPATSGQGLAFEINPAVGSSDGQQALFGGWFTYAAANVEQSRKGRRWYTLQGAVGWREFEPSSPSYLVGSDVAIYETSGGTFATPNTPSAIINRKRVGSASVVFGSASPNYYLVSQEFSCAQAILTYQFDAGENSGRGGSIALQRLGPAPTDCGLPP